MDCQFAAYFQPAIYCTCIMNSFFGRNLGLCLLLSAVVAHAQTQFDTAGTRPNSSGLTRITRDLVRKVAEAEMKPVAANSMI
jgi:hypothetical protein